MSHQDHTVHITFQPALIAVLRDLVDAYARAHPAPPSTTDATSFQVAAFTQPLGDTMIDSTTLTPLVPGTAVPAGNRVVFGVTNDPPGSKISGLTATSTIDPQPLVDSQDQATNYVLCDPIADQTLDSVITFGDPDGSPTGTATIDWNAGVVTDATGFVISAFTQPIAVPVPAAARRATRR